MITNKLFNVALTGVVMLSSVFSFAQDNAPCYGSEIINYTVGTKKNSANLVDLNRRDASKALGIPEDDDATENFVSLGYGGSITIRFSGGIVDQPGNDIMVIETSYASNDCLSDGIERANVEVSQDGDVFVSVGQVCRNGGVDFSGTGLAYVTEIRISNDASSTTTDGYDVDGVIAIYGCDPNIGRETCNADEVVDFFQGTRSNGQPITDPIRLDPSKALGVPENDRSNGADNFFSLGKDGWIILKMGGGILTDGTAAADLRVYETTYGDQSCSNYPEYAEVSVSQDGEFWYVLDTVCQSSNISLDIDGAIPAGLVVSYVRIANDSQLGSTDDYFDVDGVEALFGCIEDPIIDRGECYADCSSGSTYVQGTKKNGTPIAENRSHPEMANGVPQQDDTINFVTLGYGGSLTLCFDGAVFNGEGDDLMIIETSFGSPDCEDYKEFADVSVSIDGLTWYPVETGCLDFSVDISNAPIFLPFINYVRISNNNELSLTEDGYDVDGVIVLNGDCPEVQESALAVKASQPATEMTAWPNPSKGNLNFSFTSYETGNSSLELYNLNGQLVAKVFSGKTNAGEETKVNFNTSNVPNGIYMSKLTTKNGVVSGKVVIAQ